MKRTVLTWVPILLVVLWLAGCGRSNDADPSTSSGQSGSNETSATETPSKSSAMQGSKQQEIESALAGLSGADADTARQQRTCPVSGELLGSMGAPQKVLLKEREVWICCAACESTLIENADDYLSQLNEN